MNIHLPVAPSGANSVPGSGEGPHGRHEKLDGNFAAALAETAGESADETVRDEPGLQKSDDAGVRARVGRHVGARHGRDAHGRDAREHLNGEVPMPCADVANETGTDVRSKRTHRADHKALAKAAAKEPREASDVPTTSIAPDSAPAATAAREVLAVLAVDLTARPERAAGPELVAAVRKGAGPRATEPSMLRSERADSAEFGDETEIEEAAVIPVRVVRQEKHFQAAGIEVRRWQIAQDAFEAGRAAPTPETPKPVPSDALPRERPVAPATRARTVEAMMPVAGPAAPGAAVDVAPGAVGLQIADGVQEALSAPTEPSASSAPPSGAIFEPHTRQTFAPALRVIKLQLNPAELGAVTIVLSGNDQGLRVELAAELADTVSKVENDRGVLAARLHGAGYSVSDINVARLAGQAMDGDARDHAGRHGGQQEQLLGNGARDGGARDGGAQQAEQHAGRRAGATYVGAGAGPGFSPDAASRPVVAGVSYAGRFRPV
jgi:hypothetical protein